MSKSRMRRTATRVKAAIAQIVRLRVRRSSSGDDGASTSSPQEMHRRVPLLRTSMSMSQSRAPANITRNTALARLQTLGPLRSPQRDQSDPQTPTTKAKAETPTTSRLRESGFGSLARGPPHERHEVGASLALIESFIVLMRWTAALVLLQALSR